MCPLADRHRRAYKRRLVSRLYRMMSHRGMRGVAVGAITLGYSLTMIAATGIPAGAAEHMEFLLWFGGALLVLSGVAVFSVKTFVTPAIEKAIVIAFKEHGKDPDAHSAYLKRLEYDSRHDQLVGMVGSVGLTLAALRGQLKADRRIEREAAKEQESEEIE